MNSKKTIVWGLTAAITAAGVITAYAQMGPAHPQHNNKSEQVCCL